MFKTGSVHKAVAVSLLFGSGVALAQTSDPDISELANAAQLVVHSRVSKVEYRMSATGEQGQPSVPNTIVTYEVLRSVRGEGPASITLRYAGGPDGRGHILQPSNVPVFQVGDEDVLFVQNNGTNACPLVGCIDGRYRVLNGAVYDGDGAPVQAISSGKVVSGAGAIPAEFATVRYPAPAFDELMKNPDAREAVKKSGLTLEQARRQYLAQAPQTVEVTSVAGAPQGSDSSASGPGRSMSANVERIQAQPMSLDAFVSAVQSSAPMSANRADSSFRSVSPDARIPAPNTQPVAPGASPQSSAAVQRSPADVAEEQALPKDDATITEKKSR